MKDSKKKLFSFAYNKLSKHIKKGDAIYIELDTSKFKKVYNVSKNRNQFADFFFTLFKKLVGKNGTFITPSFSHSWGKSSKKKKFDLKYTESKTGMFSRFLMNKKEIVRSLDPMFSVLVFGKEKKYYTNNTNDSFGAGSVFHKIHLKNCKLISFGINQFDPTFVHYVEQYYDQNIKRIKYRKLKYLNGLIINQNKKKRGRFKTFLRTLSMNRIYSEKKIVKDLAKNNYLKLLNLFGSKIQICSSVDFFNQGIRGMKKDINYFSKKI